MDTLWWFDGALTWHRTGLRNHALGIAAPAYSVVVDPGDARTVYVGTAVGVWKGTLNDPEMPVWDWEPCNVGLPEGAVQDLSVGVYGTRRILRAAVQARGVWEITISGEPHVPMTYVKARHFDSRYPGVAGDHEIPDTSTIAFVRSTRARECCDSPDIQLRPVPGTMSPAPVLPVSQDGTVDRDLWAFQCALHDSDPLCRPTGRWSKTFESRLRRFRAANPVGGVPVPAASLGVLDQDVWDQMFATPAHAFAPMWDGTEPIEADFYELFGCDGSAAPGRTIAAVSRVDVLVHHRDMRAVAADRVSVTVVWAEVGSAPADWDAITLDAAVTTPIVGVLTGGGLAPIAAPWTFVEPVIPIRHPTAPVDARTPRSMSFGTDLTGQAGRTFAFVCAVSTPDDPITLAPGNLRDLVLANHHVACRIVRVV